MSKPLADTGNILTALKTITDFLIKNKISFCLIGGLAVQLRGEPRYTRDIDICLATSLDDQDEIINLIINYFDPLMKDSLEFAKSSQILPLKINGVIVDLSLGLTGFEKNVISRASIEEFTQDLKIKVCSSEDLIIYKCLAGRPRDIHDIDSVVRKNIALLDLNYIRSTLKEFENLLSNNQLINLLESRLKLVGNN